MYFLSFVGCLFKSSTHFFLMVVFVIVLLQYAFILDVGALLVESIFSHSTASCRCSVLDGCL